MSTDRPAWRPPESYRVPAGVLVPARICEILDRVGRLRDLRVAVRGRDAEFDALMIAVADEAARYRVSVTGSEDPPPAETSARSTVVTTRQAADLLGVTERRVRQLVADHLIDGEFRAGRWEVDRLSVEHHRAGRLAA